MMNWLKDFSKYKKVMQVFLVLGLLSLLGSIFVDEDAIKGMLMGFGTSVTLIGAINMMVMFIKEKKNAEYEAEKNLEFGDERIRINKLKILAKSGVFGMLTLAFSNVVHLLFDTNLLISNIVVIFAYTFAVLGLKIYYKNK